MKSAFVLTLLIASAAQLPDALATDKTEYLERTSQKNLERADRHEKKAENDVVENKLHGAQRHAKKAAVDEIKSDKQEQRVQAKKSEAESKP